MEQPNYRQLEGQFAAAGLALAPAEAHGLLCGLAVSGVEDAEQRWLDLVLEDTDPADLLVQECRDALSSLSASGGSALEGLDLGLHPLLPEDERPLPARAQALAEWCQGYLYGFGLSGAGEEALSPESREALRDLGRIAAMAGVPPGAGEAEEQALVELVEFVWVAFLLIRQDLRARPGAPA